jgi:hypothetical protein
MRRIAFALCALVILPITLLTAGVITDAVDVKFDQWMTPSTPAYPHDPAVAPDGSMIKTQRQRRRPLRSATQRFEFALPTPNSGPHGCRRTGGNIWYTGTPRG